jgi:DNA-binding NarL/FixJ family response regulator
MAKQANPLQPKRNQIFLIDDHEVPRQGFAALIEREPDFHVCGQAGGSSEALEMLATMTPDLIVSDLSLPGTSGVDFIKLLRRNCADVPVLVFTMHDERVYGERVLRAGASGYVMKSEPSASVMTAIRSVLSGDRFLSQPMQNDLLNRFLKNNTELQTENSQINCLTNRELEVVQLIGEGLKSSQVASRLGISVKTIESHRENIKSKLALKNSVELTRFAFQCANPQSGL